MKRSELTVGMVVAVGRLDGGSSRIRKATVLQTSADRAAKHSWGQTQLLGGVMIQFESNMTAMGNTTPKEIVSLSQICGPWDSTSAQVEEWKKAAQDQRITKETHRAQARVDAERAVEDLKRKGISAQVEFVGQWDTGWYRVTLDPTTAQKLADLLNA